MTIDSVLDNNLHEENRLLRKQMVDYEMQSMMDKNIYLLALERTGWRRWVFGRWVYSSEPFRRDIQRINARTQLKMMLRPWERIYDPSDT